MPFEQIEASLEAAGQQIASLWGDSFQVVRPDYTQSNAPETIIFNRINFRVDPIGTWAEPAIGGVDYYQVVGTRVIKSGDVLISVGGDTSPTMTIISGGIGKPFYGTYTNLIGTITDGADDGARTLYSNVRFKLFTLPSVGEGLDSSLLGSLGASVQRALIYTGRTGIEQGMWLRWTLPGLPNAPVLQKAARIEASTSRLNQLVLNISDNPGR